MPSHVCRALYQQMLPHLRPDMIFVSATKGIDNDRLMRMSEVIRSVVEQKFPPRLCALSGPSFAKEVMRGDPTAVVVASDDREAAQTVQREFSSGVLRLYTSSDVVGVELGDCLIRRRSFGSDYSKMWILGKPPPSVPKTTRRSGR